MIGNIIIWLIVLLATVGFGWLVTRAWRAGNPVLKWVGVVLSGLLTIIGYAAVAGWLV